MPPPSLTCLHRSSLLVWSRVCYCWCCLRRGTDILCCRCYFHSSGSRGQSWCRCYFHWSGSRGQSWYRCIPCCIMDICSCWYCCRTWGAAFTNTSFPTVLYKISSNGRRPTVPHITFTVLVIVNVDTRLDVKSIHKKVVGNPFFDIHLSSRNEHFSLKSLLNLMTFFAENSFPLPHQVTLTLHFVRICTTFFHFHVEIISIKMLWEYFLNMIHQSTPWRRVPCGCNFPFWRKHP